KSAARDTNGNGDQLLQARKSADEATESPPSRSSATSSSSSPAREETTSSKEEKSGTQNTLTGIIAQIFNKGSSNMSSTPTLNIDSEKFEIIKE
ncbi:hypothetical protein PIB30_050449, partial [Stylosanthes scabra]|nr:hypothetical protein [Stylosanthes scabra]